MRLNLTFLLPQDVLSGAWRQVWGQLGEMGDTAKLGMNVRKIILVGFDPGLIQSPSKLLALAVAVPLPSAPLCRASRSACRSGLIETPPVATGSTPLFGDFP